MIFLPSRGRPYLLGRFFKEGKPKNEGVVILDEDDEINYRGIHIPDNWVKVVYPRNCITVQLNKTFANFPNKEWYGLAADDLVPVEGWDEALSEACLGGFIAYGDDGIQGSRLCTHPFISGDLVRKVGWIQYPGVKHLYGDTIWMTIGHSTGKLKYLPNVKTTHLHFSNGGVYDKTYEERQIEGDPQGFQNFLNELPDILKRTQ